MRDLSSGASALLRAGRTAFRPTASDRERVLQALVPRLGEDSPVERSGPVRAGRDRLGLRLPRLSLLIGGATALALLIGGAAVVSHARSKAHPPSTFVASVVAAPSASLEVPSVTASSPTERDEAVAPSPVETSTPPPHPAARSTARPARPASADSLAEEVRLLALAEEQANAGRDEDALATLREHERRFPKGALTEDRMAARAEVLCALGRFSIARTELARLARAFPSSAHLESARAYCGDGLRALR